MSDTRKYEPMILCLQLRNFHVMQLVHVTNTTLTIVRVIIDVLIGFGMDAEVCARRGAI